MKSFYSQQWLPFLKEVEALLQPGGMDDEDIELINATPSEQRMFAFGLIIGMRAGTGLHDVSAVESLSREYVSTLVELAEKEQAESPLS